MINPPSFNPNSVPNSPGSYSAWLNSRMNPSDPKSILTPQEAAPDLFRYGEMLGMYKPSSSELPRTAEVPRELTPKGEMTQKSFKDSLSETASTAGRDAVAGLRTHMDRPNPFTMNPVPEASNGTTLPQTNASEPGQNSISPFSTDNSQTSLTQENRPQQNIQASTRSPLPVQQMQNQGLPTPPDSPVLGPNKNAPANSPWVQGGQTSNENPLSDHAQKQSELPTPPSSPVLKPIVPQDQKQMGSNGQPLPPRDQQQPGPNGKPLPPQDQQQPGSNGQPLPPRDQQQPGANGRPLP